jgi:uncharacterized membrane protein
MGYLASQSTSGVTVGGTGLTLTILPITLFAAGALSMLLLWLGWKVTGSGVRRRSAQRKEMKQLRATTPPQSPERPTDPSM